MERTSILLWLYAETAEQEAKEQINNLKSGTGTTEKNFLIII